MDFKIIFVLCLLFASSSGTFHKFFSGQCPTVDSLPDFNIDRFLGQWYVIENYNDNAMLCLRENFTVSEESTNKKELLDMARNELESDKDSEQSYQVKRSYLSVDSRQLMHETGKIKFISNVSQAEMEVSYPFTETGMLNMKHYQVVATDYERYALVWRCQRTIFGHRRAAQIMSRQATLALKTLLELQTMLKHMELDESVRMNEVCQTNCEPATQAPLTTRKPVRVKPSKPDRTLLPVLPVDFDHEKPESVQPIVKVITDKNTGKNHKKLISIDVGGFHLSIHFPFW